MMKHLTLLCLCATLLACPVLAQTVDLSSRTFWIGEVPVTMEGETPFVALSDIDWIEDILLEDPVMKNAVFHLEQEYISSENSVAASVRRLQPKAIMINPDQIPPQFSLPDYQIYGSSQDTVFMDLTYMPKDPGAGFKVSCYRMQSDRDRFDLCAIYATYPPDDHIRLKARLYFPPSLAEAPTQFRDVVDRMREVAYCLDVTDKLVDVPTVHPDLTDCKPDEVS